MFKILTNKLAVTLLVLIASFAWVGCSVDEEILDGKKCSPTSKDNSQLCVEGYTCDCDFNSNCVCKKSNVKTQALIEDEELNSSAGSPVTPEEP